MEEEASAPCFLEGYKWNNEGYLVSIQSSASEEEEPMLLDSIANLLNLLHPPPRQDDEDDKDDEGIDVEDEKDKMEEEMEALVVEDSPPTKRPKKEPTPPEYQHLVRFPNLADKLQTALNNIDKMKVSNVPTPRRDRSVSHTERQRRGKVQALEKQREASRLQQERNGSDTGLEVSTEDCSSSTLRLVQTLNSIRALFPLLVEALNHKDRNNTGINIQTFDIQPKKGKQRCFFIMEDVFDVAPVGACRVLERDLKKLLGSVLHNDELVKNVMANKQDWDTLLPTCLENIGKPDTLELLLNQNRGMDICRACDEQHGTPLLRDQRLAAAYTQSMHSLRNRLEGLICRKYDRGARLTVYGSCLSDLALGNSSDVDISLFLPQAHEARRDFEQGHLTASQYEKTLKNLVYKITNIVRSCPHISKVQPVARARVPVVKGTYNQAQNPYSPDGSLSFDICFSNDIAVANSSLLREYSLLDPRVKLLMLMVKKWAQYHRINVAANNTLSSYAWMILVIFYCQNVGLVPNLQCRDLWKKHRLAWDPNVAFHNINGLQTVFLTWSQVQRGGHWITPSQLEHVPVTALLYGFFHFYAGSFPGSLYAISIRHGTTPLLTAEYPKARLGHLFCIEDPFETFDSHCPHDLAMPCDQPGQVKIYHLMQEAKQELHHILMVYGDSNCPWIWANESDKEQPATAPKPKRKRNRQRSQGGRGGGGGGGGGKRKEVVNAKNGNKTQDGHVAHGGPRQNKPGKKKSENKGHAQNGMVQLANGHVAESGARLNKPGEKKKSENNGNKGQRKHDSGAPKRKSKKSVKTEGQALSENS